MSEAENGSGGMFGVDGVRRVLSGLDLGCVDAEGVTRLVVDAVHGFAGGHRQSDDITCLILTVSSDGVAMAT